MILGYFDFSQYSNNSAEPSNEVIQVRETMMRKLNSVTQISNF
jgi:hypothetical protein